MLYLGDLPCLSYLYLWGSKVIKFRTYWKRLRVLEMYRESWERKQSQIPRSLLCWRCLGLARPAPIRSALLGLPFRDPFITSFDCSLRHSLVDLDDCTGNTVLVLPPED